MIEIFLVVPALILLSFMIYLSFSIGGARREIDEASMNHKKRMDYALWLVCVDHFGERG